MSDQDVEPPEDYRILLDAEELKGQGDFDHLIGLDHLPEVQQLEYQKQACLRALREMRGRGLLADEVGLGKTIEAGLILKEYLLRGLVHRALVLVPASLTIQWREELANKFGLEFEIAGRRGDWADHPFLICSLDTAKTTRNRERLLNAPVRPGDRRRGAPAPQPPDPGLEVRGRGQQQVPAPAHGHPGAERPAGALQPGEPAPARHAGHLPAIPPRLHGARRQAAAQEHRRAVQAPSPGHDPHHPGQDQHQVPAPHRPHAAVPTQRVGAGPLRRGDRVRARLDISTATARSS